MRARALFRPCARLAALCAFAFLLADCAPHRPPAGPPDPGIESAGTFPRDSSLRFQIVYLIHGDAGYLWYDDAGIRHQADAEALAQARRTAEEASAAEVFIFHQKPTRFLGVFHGSDGTLWHYRKGRLLRRIPYARPGADGDGRSDDALAPEAALFARFAAMPAPRRCGQATATADPPVRILAYFGHGIPVTGKVPYNRSRPDIAFSLESFSRGLVRFGGPACPPNKPFSLVILSACHGGTPEATLALAPYTEWVLAAPGELHLSYLETGALARLARENPIPFETGHAGLWGRAIAEESFARLGATVRTGVTVSLYETARASEYLEARRGAWMASALTPVATVAGPILFAEPAAYRDCGLNPAFGEGGAMAGVQVFHRPARFGADRGKASHSGWECPVAEARQASIP